MKKNWLIISGIAVILYFIFFYNLGLPALLDSDETRYADMARAMLYSKDFITLHLDGRIFWDKPPLFFWLLCLSYKLLGINEFAVRIPSVLCALSAIIALFFAVSKAYSRKLGFIAVLILASSVEFVIFSRISILDMVLTSNITLSLLCGLMTYFVKEENKKFFWLGFYLFSAFGVLAKGIPAVVIPFGTMFFVGIWKKNIKDFFKPKYFVFGAILFLIIVLPWHALMYKIHGSEFIKEYIIKHHLMRFAGSREIGREHSFIYYIPTFMIGFLPWIFSFLFGLKKLITKRNPDFVTMNLIGFAFTFIFFSIAGTKLITYILPLYPMAAIICAYMWINPVFEKEVKYSILFTNSIFIIFAILVSLSGLYLPDNLYGIIRPVQIPLILAFSLCAIWRKKERAFVAYIILIAFLSGFMLPKFLNIWYSFGQNELMSYAEYARENNLPLGAYNLWERFSLQYYYGGDIEYFQKGEAYGAKYVSAAKFNNTFNNYPIVTPNACLSEIGIGYKFIKKGTRYSLIEED